MYSFDKIFYLSDFFEKNAQAVKLQHQLERKHEELNRVKDLLLFLTGKNIPLEEIDYWLTQNDSTLKDYYIRVYNMDTDHYEHVLKQYKYFNKKDTYGIISTSNDFENNIQYDIIKHGFLKGYKGIPNLYIFSAVNSGFTSEPISKTLSPFAFIEKALKNIESLNSNDLIELFPQFIQDNKDKLLKLMSSFSYAPKYIGGGIDGSAFDVGNNLIFKIFTESYSYYKAKEAYERLHKNPDLAKNEAMIYDVGILGNFANTTLYYYIMEKMIPVDDTMNIYLSKIINYIGQYIRNFQDSINQYKKLLHDPKNNDKVKNFLTTTSERIEKELYSEHSKEIYNMETYVDDLNKDWVKSLCEEILFKYITGRGDLHLGNLGLTNYGKFVYFDPSHSYWENNKDLINTPSKDSVDFIDQQNESDMFI